jgi:heterodisulfide reductase subunit C2
MTKRRSDKDVIDTSKLDPDFKYEVAETPGGEHIKRCFACASCTLSCPVSEVDPAYSPRRLVHMILLGMKDEVLSSDLIWYCLNCYRCYVHCPQDVQFTHVMEVLRSLAVKEGYAEPSLLAKVNEIDREMQDVRRKKIDEMLKGRKKGKNIEARLSRLRRGNPKSETNSKS